MTTDSRQNPAIELLGIDFAYAGGRTVLSGLDFSFYPRDRIGLVAPNGSGKTTLFHIIMGLERPTAGTVRVFGKERQAEADFLEVRRRIGLLFQDADDQLFSPTVIEDVAFGPLNQGKTPAEAVEISKKTLAFLGLESFADRITFKLSGGEKRMAALAAVLAMEPEILLLDEPSAGLDDAVKARLAETLSALDVGFIVVSHEIDFLSRLTDVIYTLDGGRILLEEDAHPHEHVHAHPYGKKPHKHDQ